MDDFPAGPASPGPRRPPLTVVIPVHNGGPDFERCLRELRVSTWTDFELIVVDDGSTDGSAAVAETFGARVERHDVPQGPAAARNHGAKVATAPIVFFLDADVALHRDTLARAMAHFAELPQLDALFGSYDDTPAAPSLVSQYRNLLHHFVHQQGSFHGEMRPAHTFWTGCGAIRREVFLAIGGFDPLLYRRPAIEDIELGYRLTAAGYQIALARDVQATHLKRWTLRQIVLTDTFQRGVPWMLLMLRSRYPETDLNVNRAQQLCVAATGLGLVGLAAVPLVRFAWIVPLLNVGLLAGFNRRFYGFLARKKGLGFTAAAFPLHYLYFCCCGFSVALALAIKHVPWLVPARVERPVSAVVQARADAPATHRPRAPRPRKESRWTRR